MSTIRDVFAFFLFLVGLVLMLNSFNVFDKKDQAKATKESLSKNQDFFGNSLLPETPQPVSGDKRTAMLWAVANGQLELVNKLLKDGVPGHLPIRNGIAPIFLAIEYGRTQIFQALMKVVPTLELKNRQGDTLMLYAIKKNRPDIAIILLEAGANWRFKDWGNRTILHWAATNGDLRLVSRIVEQIKVVDPISVENWTPMHYAARKGHYAIVKLLLEKGADPKLRLTYGWTPADLARGKRHLDVEKLINSFQPAH